MLPMASTPREMPPGGWGGGGGRGPGGASSAAREHAGATCRGLAPQGGLPASSSRSPSAGLGPGAPGGDAHQPGRR